MIATEILKDLVVVELASVLAGPAVGMFFAELGARVIKIENKKTGGDVTRQWKLPTENPEKQTSAYYQSVNWGKEVLFLDLTDAADRDLAFSYIAQADIVISNFRLPSARKLGLDYDSLHPSFPQLLYGQITAFGEDSDLPAFDIVLQAEAGFLFMTGEPDRPPSRMPVALIDLLAAHQLKEGLLLALLRREKTGEGAYVSVSLRDAAVASLANQATNWLVAGQIPHRMGSRHPNIAPYGDIFTTSDGRQIVLAVGSEGQFTALCTALGLEIGLTDPRFRRNDLRLRHREALAGILAEAIGALTIEELGQLLQKLQVPYGRIRNMEEVFADPEVAELVLQARPGKENEGNCVRTVAFSLK